MPRKSTWTDHTINKFSPFIKRDQYSLFEVVLEDPPDQGPKPRRQYWKYECVNGEIDERDVTTANFKFWILNQLI